MRAGHGTIAACVLLLAVTATPGAAVADDSTAPSLDTTLRDGLEPHVVVIDVQLGIAGSIAERGPHVLESDGAPLGVMAGFTVGYRTPFFITPAIDFGYYGLGGSTDRVMDPSGTSRLVDNRLELVTLSFGLLIDLWRFRIRAGTGLFSLSLDSRIGGAVAQTSRTDFGYLLGVTGYFYRSEGKQLGLEGRVAVDAGNDIVVLTLGLVATFDAFGL